MNNRPTCVDLFAGVGGLSLGFEQAGFDVVCAVENDPVHSAAHKYNFPDTPVICAGVEDVTPEQIRAVAGLGDKKIDVVVGGSPCQGFSMIGKRSLDDPRNSLVLHFMRLVAGLDADYFVLENVKGLTIGQHKSFLDEIVEGFTERGYEISLPWKVLNAASYGVPQSRERLFIVGAKNGLKLPEYPEALFNGARLKNPVPDLPAGPTVMDALGDLPDAEDFEELTKSDAVKTDLGNPSEYAAVLRGLTPDETDFSHPRIWDPSYLTSSARTQHEPPIRQRFAETACGKTEPISRFLRLRPDGLCNTLRAGTGKKNGAHTAARPIHPLYARCITVREMARLHSYPDWFRFNHTKWSGAREVGNSVPPLLARAVGRSVLKAMGINPSKPNRRMALGPESLLKVDETAAIKLIESFTDRNLVKNVDTA